MNRQDFVTLFHLKSKETITEKSFGLFCDISHDEDWDNVYKTTTKAMMDLIKKALSETEFKDMLPDFNDIYQLIEWSDLYPYETNDNHYQAYISFNDVYRLLNDKYQISARNSINIYRIESDNDKGIYSAALNKLFYEMVALCIEHHSKNERQEHTDAIRTLKLKANKPEDILTHSDCNSILYYAKNLSIEIPEKYLFFMTDDHNILSPCDDGILKSLFNKKRINHEPLQEWFFAFNTEKELNQWIKDSDTIDVLKLINAKMTTYSINDSDILKSEYQNSFIKEKASVITSKLIL